jgi:hypothetical protein
MNKLIKAFISISILIGLNACQSLQVKQRQIIYQIENDRAIKLLFENDTIVQLNLRELKSTNQNINKEDLIIQHSKDYQAFSNLTDIYLALDSTDFQNNIDNETYPIVIYIENDILDPKYSQNLEIGYSLTTFINFKDDINIESLSKVYEYYGISQSSMTDTGLSYIKLLEDEYFKFNDVFKKGVMVELDPN